MKPLELPQQLLSLARLISEDCTQCRACQVRCAFLRESGTPKNLADQLLGGGPGIGRAFECSLCGLCQASCPMNLPLPEFFLAMRQAALANQIASLNPYRSILNYEAVGASALFRLVSLPSGGDTVLFPGCTFPGAHPRTALALYQHLRASDPALGMVLGCCFKPSHDLGRRDFFERRFGTLRATLLARGVRTVLTACPNCFKVFTQHGDGLAVRSVLCALKDNPPQKQVPVRGTGIMHTPCPLRFEKEEREIALRLACKSGLDVERIRQGGTLAPCCGEGGTVGALRPEYADAWTQDVEKSAKGRMVVTTCAGCTKFISRRTPAIHLLDLMFFPQAAMGGTLPRPRGIAAYMHRLRFKWRVWLENRPRPGRG